jgi:hypothetical protein
MVCCSFCGYGMLLLPLRNRSRPSRFGIAIIGNEREREERHLPRTGGRGRGTGCMRRAAVLGLDSAGRPWRGRRRDSWSRQQHVQVDEDAVRDEKGERASNHGIRPSPSLPAVNATAIISVHLFFFLFLGRKSPCLNLLQQNSSGGSSRSVLQR